MTLSTFSRVTWPIVLILNGLMVGVMLLRRRARQFPVLTAYFVWMLVNSLTSIYVYMYRGSAEPVQLNYAQIAVGELLMVAIFLELAAHVFCPTGTWAPDLRRAFLLLVSGGIVLAAVLTLLDHPIAPSHATALELRSYFFTCVLLGELFAGTVVLSATVGLPWKTHVARVAHGLGAYSLLCLALNVVSNSVGILPNPHIYVLLFRANGVAWIVCQGYLVVVLWREAPAPRELPEQLRIQLYRLNQHLETELVRVRQWTRG